jgi:hypothetical protein
MKFQQRPDLQPSSVFFPGRPLTQPQSQGCRPPLASPKGQTRVALYQYGAFAYNISSAYGATGDLQSAIDSIEHMQHSHSCHTRCFGADHNM